MKKLTLLTILILALAISPAYAEDTAVEDTAAEESDADSTVETPELKPASAALAAADTGPLSTPEAGITGSAMPFLQESFRTDLATGAATLTIPITVPPGRKNMQPNIALSYSSNNSNGICGVGWGIPINAIQRSTKKGVPKYGDSDTFVSSGTELVNIDGNEYRAKIEGAFMRYVFRDNVWTVYDKSGTKYTFGSENGLQPGFAIPRLENSGKTFAWYLNEVIDVYGNYIIYTYDKPADGQIYLKEITYTGGTNLTTDTSRIFNYAENGQRTDKLSSYRSGWKITTSRILTSIEIKLNNERVWLYKLDYITSEDTSRSLIREITVFDKDGKSLPPKKFTYQKLED